MHGLNKESGSVKDSASRLTVVVNNNSFPCTLS